MVLAEKEKRRAEFENDVLLALWVNIFRHQTQEKIQQQGIEEGRMPRSDTKHDAFRPWANEQPSTTRFCAQQCPSARFTDVVEWEGKGRSFPVVGNGPPSGVSDPSSTRIKL
uniref:Uncharacterized protein n=1 Tax=Noctiluca scintillans TaxID=2966 RepID=A0A7S1A8L1_NOCSC|mmetsp:Transcript_35164/g.93731  ORF Transcript_35164/g.93731 Transcript_35164/m.93731 type:complete len:112 (+) Transcript_35164:57-392(+)